MARGPKRSRTTHGPSGGSAAQRARLIARRRSGSPGTAPVAAHRRRYRYPPPILVRRLFGSNSPPRVARLPTPRPPWPLTPRLLASAPTLGRCCTTRTLRLGRPGGRLAPAAPLGPQPCPRRRRPSQPSAPRHYGAGLSTQRRPHPRRVRLLGGRPSPAPHLGPPPGPRGRRLSQLPAPHLHGAAPALPRRPHPSRV